MNTQGTPTPYLTITEAAEYCGVSTKTLRRATRSRRLAYYRTARAYRFTIEDLESFMRAARFGVVDFRTVI